MLTIEELKTLQVGDWVWVEDKAMGLSHYRQKNHHDTTHCLFERCINDMALNIFRWKDYGKSWLAYKNKEEAEGESITLPYLLCTSNKFACVIWQDKDGKVKKTYTMPIEEAKGVLKEKESATNE